MKTPASKGLLFAMIASAATASIAYCEDRYFDVSSGYWDVASSWNPSTSPPDETKGAHVDVASCTCYVRLTQNNVLYLNIAEYHQDCVVYQYASSRLIVHGNLQVATRAHSSGMYYISGGHLIVTSMQGYCKIGVGDHADGYIINDGGYISIQRDLNLGYGDYAVGSCMLTNTSSRLNVSGDINLGSISNSNGILDVGHGEVDVGGNLSVGGRATGRSRLTTQQRS